MAFNQAISKPLPKEQRQNEWISEETWHLSNTRMAVRQEPQCDQRLMQEIGRKVWASLQAEKTRCAGTAVTEVKELLVLDPPLGKEAWI